MCVMLNVMRLDVGMKIIFGNGCVMIVMCVDVDDDDDGDCWECDVDVCGVNEGVEGMMSEWELRVAFEVWDAAAARDAARVMLSVCGDDVVGV